MTGPSTSVAPPQVIDTCLQLRRVVEAARREGKRIGIVPTMGALHEGHLSLVRACRAECDLTLVTIFVNPTQFGPGEDLERYPRSFEKDVEFLTELGCDLVFAPAAGEMYPPGLSTSIDPPASARPLEGQCRPGHFAGVATVVLKLLNLAGADRAYFGHKDYQQSLVVRHMVRDLNVPTEIEVCPTVREPDGLALSSRNAYLSEDERRRAVSLSRGLRRAAELVAGGERDAAAVRAALQAELLAGDVTDVDYVALVEPETLEPVDRIDAEVVALVAARVGATRLIDNMRLAPP